MARTSTTIIAHRQYSSPIRTLPSLSDIYIAVINSLGSANTTLRQDIDALEKNVDEMRENDQDLKVQVLELETANLRLCVDNENLKIQLDALEVCDNQLRIDIQEQSKKQTEKFEEFQKRIEKLDKENNGLKGKISSIESNFVKFMLSNRSVEKSQGQHLGLRVKSSSY